MTMPLLRLKYPNETPPGYWRFPRHPEIPLTGDPNEFIPGGDIQDLTTKVHNFRVVNRLPLGDPQSEIEDWICRNTGAQCVPARAITFKPGVMAKGQMVARFLSAMAQWMAQGGHVPQEEAEARAELCAGCPWNAHIDDITCFGCFGLTEKVIKILGGRKTRMDESLRFCALCGCSNAVSAFVPMEILARAHKLEEFPIDIGNGTPCWKRAYAEKTT